MGKMDHMSNDSWTTVSTTSAVSPVAVTTPLHRQQDVIVREDGPDYLSSQRPKNSDTTSSSGSGKHRFTGLELETEPSWAEQSWMRRIRWFRNTRTHRDAGSPTKADEIPYIGGTMDSAPPIPVRTTTVGDGSAADPKAAASAASHNNINDTFTRIASWMTANSSQHDEEDVQDFEESEWTPPDSSYGAAIPLFGWIPKKTRQNIEFSILLVLVLVLVYLMVILSIMISEARRDNSLAEDTALNLDDDRYIGYSDDTVSSNDDDPYWAASYSNNNAYSGNNGYGG